MYTPKRKISTETGQVPRYEPLTSAAGEPLQPMTLPEMPEPSATTGIVQIVTDGLDDAADADDPRPARR